jgi:hypothetical protein
VKKTEAMSISIGVLGAVDTLLTATVVKVPVWVTFIAWASFFAVGGGKDGWKKSILSNIAGIVIASLTLLVISLLEASPVLAAICVGVGSAGMVQASRVPILAFTPAVVWGFASTVGTTVATGVPITTLGPSNPMIVAIAAMLIGDSFGLLSELWGNAMAREPSGVAAHAAGPRT